MKSKILEINNKRKEFLKIREDSYDEDINSYGIEPKEIDELSDQIIDLILTHSVDLEVDFILESLTYLGHAPNILYDDNGSFSVTCDGTQSISFGDEPVDVEMSFFVPKERWFPTIRKALNHFLEELDPEFWNNIQRGKKLERL